MKKAVFIFLAILSVTFSCQSGLSEKEKAVYYQRGKEIAQATAKYLGGEVKKKMKEGGVAKAVPFCNAHATDFTNEMAKKYHAVIKRTSHKLRNEKNAPTDAETTQLKKFAEALAKGETLRPVVNQDTEGTIQFYAPIKVQKKCLSCHGVVGETMKQKSDSIIKVLYPNDKATGFKEGDLRGMWSINFKKTEK